MAAGSSTLPSKETVSLKLPTGEMVDAIVPGGLDDEGVKSYVRMKRPDLFGPPAGIPAPKQPDMQPSYLAHALGADNTSRSAVANPQQPAEQFALENPEQQGKLAAASVVGAAGSLPGTVPTIARTARALLPAVKTGAKVGTATAATEAVIQGVKRLPFLGQYVAKIPGVDYLPFLIGTMAGGSKEEPKPTYPGAPEPTALPEQLNPALASEARTTPGQIGPERIYGPRPKPAEPIPPRQGLMLPGKVAPEPEPTYPGGPYPEKPSPELFKSRSLQEGPRPVKDPAAGLGQIPVVNQHLPFIPKPKQVQAQIERGLGNEPMQIKPGVPIGKQNVPTGPLPAEVPPGHIPVESSALKSYKYDPAAREFHVATKSGGVYIYGDVGPDEVAAFEQSPSKGAAFQQIKSNPLVAKVVNGKRVATKPVSKSADQGNDLTDILTRSLQQVKGQR